VSCEVPSCALPLCACVLCMSCVALIKMVSDKQVNMRAVYLIWILRIVGNILNMMIRILIGIVGALPIS